MKKRIISLLLVVATALPVIQASAASERGIPFFIEANRSRYTAYHTATPGISFNTAVALVNANVDFGFFNGIQTVNNPNSITVLLNKNHALPANYHPPDLVDIGGGYLLRAEAAAQFNRMRSVMSAMGMPLHITSAYRSASTQSFLYNRAISRSGRASADRQIARPGHSEHQAGLVVDVVHRAGSGSMSSYRFQDTRQYAWMMQNAHSYGFILRYPSNLSHIHGYIFEPWHWRYIGVEAATRMHTEGIALFEDYYGRYLAPGIYSSVPAFSDVTSGSVAFTAVNWAHGNNLVTGSGDRFYPNDEMTRSQFALVMHRYAGRPPVSSVGRFIDVPVSMVSYGAITWAHENGIITGSGDRFFPNDKMTRAQMVLMLYRYSRLTGKNLHYNPSALDSFSDRGEVSSIVSEAMRWAVTHGLITGNAGRLMPNNSVTRAQVVLILYRYSNLFS